jgi:hypothetical protein
LAEDRVHGKRTTAQRGGFDGRYEKFVAANPDTIGYIETAAVDGSVKVVVSVD